MSETNKIETAQATLLEIQATVERELARARHALIEAADENRRLSAEARKQNFTVYTEKDVAAIFQVNEQTIARLRKSGRISCLRFGALTRYTSDHLQGIAQALEKTARVKQSGLKKIEKRA